MPKLVSISQAAKLLKLSGARLKALALQKRIRGCKKVGNQYVIPLPIKILPPKKNDLTPSIASRL